MKLPIISMVELSLNLIQQMKPKYKNSTVGCKQKFVLGHKNRPSLLYRYY